MIKRETPRVIPTTARYHSVDLGEHGAWHLRFPSFGKAAALLEQMQDSDTGTDTLKGDAGIQRLIRILDVAGCAIGMSWCHRDHDLQSGDCPDLGGDGWRAYGDSVVDELQEHGLGLVEIMALLNAILTDAGKRLSEVNEAQDEGNG